MAESTVEELVENAKKPGTFSILNVLNERAYPREEVIAYLDEQAAYDASQIQSKIDELSKNEDANKAKINELAKKRDAVIKKLELSKYTFTVSGISEGMREDLNKESIEKYPIELEEEKNPFTGEVTKKEVENKERDRYFTNLIWHSAIEKIVNPDGDAQENVTMEDVIALRGMLPIAAIGALNQAIEKLRMATAVFMMTVDEDFLAKS